MSEVKKGTEVKKWDEVNGAASGEILEAFLSSEADGYAILQMNDSVEGMQFMRYDFLQSQGFNPEINFYDTVYAGPLNTQSQDIDLILDNLFMRFNVERPEDFTGHSLSVSDVIALQRQNEVKYYYVDSVGFKELPGFDSGRNPLRGIEDMVEQNDNQLDGVINNVPEGKEECAKGDKESVLEKLKEHQKLFSHQAAETERKPVRRCAHESRE